jgi:CheY-like chemotaxis protein
MNDPYEEVSILLVEDDDIDAMATERAFKKLRLANKFVRARDGIEALAYLRGEDGREKVSRPNVILLDLNMPRMNGLEFLEEIRGDDELKDQVIFILTTSKADEDKIAAYKGNVAGYIIKTDVGNGFTKVLEMLQYYWRIVSLPD